jgi:hypothetical protein
MPEVLNEVNRYAKRNIPQLELRLEELQRSKGIQIDVLERKEEDLGSEFDEIPLIEAELKRRANIQNQSEHPRGLGSFDPSKLEGDALWKFRKHFPGDKWAERELGIIDEKRDVESCIMAFLKFKRELIHLRKVAEQTDSKEVKKQLEEMEQQLEALFEKV